MIKYFRKVFDDNEQIQWRHVLHATVCYAQMHTLLVLVDGEP